MIDIARRARDRREKVRLEEEAPLQSGQAAAELADQQAPVEPSRVVLLPRAGQRAAVRVPAFFDSTRTMLLA